MIPKDEAALRTYLSQNPESFPVNWMVEAGAGAGKTFLIVQRMVNQLALGYCEPEQLVAITFTNKAANQLRDRLTAALLERRANAADPQEQKRLDHALQKSGDIQISTVHSFCQRLLQEMPLAAGLPFSFTLQEAGETWREAASFFDQCCRDHDDWFAPVRACAIQPTSLKNTFLDLLDCADEKIQQYDAAAFGQPGRQFVETAEAARQKLVQLFPVGWRPDWCAPRLRQLLEYPSITTPEQAVGWLKLLKDFADAPAQPRGTEAFSLPILHCQIDDSGDRKYTSKKIPTALVIAPDSPVRGLWNAYYEAFCGFAAADKALQKAQKAKTVKDDRIRQAQTDRNNAITQVKSLEHKPECRFVLACHTLLQTRKEMAESLQQAMGPMLHTAILQVLLRCREALTARRAARGQLSYDDLLLCCREMLKNSPYARNRLAERKLILYVDEFQDTDPIQAQILFYLTATPSTFSQDWTRCVPRPGSLFLVGDPKQSIYRFRRADMEVYNRVRTLFDGGCPGCRLAILRFNYRSSKALCDYATKIFQGEMKPENRQPVFSPMEAQNRQVPDRKVWNFTADPEAAPAGVAAWIDQAVAGGQARWQDFLILCDQKKQVELYRNALRQRHIPVNATGQHLLADTAPIARCADWCRYLLHPRDLLAAVSLLAKTGFDPATLYALQQATGQALANLLQRRPDQWTESLDAPLDEAAQMFKRMAMLRQKSIELPPAALLEELLSGDYGLWDGAPDPDYYGWVREYLAALRQWPDQSLSGLLNQAIRLCDTQLEHPMAYTDSADEVQVMNLHKAKGLEGRIVFLAPGVRRHKQSSLHRQEGSVWLCLSAKLSSPDGSQISVTANPPDWDKQCKEEAAQDKAERSRLLYVAATRARELLIVGHTPAKKNSAGTAYHPNDAWDTLLGEGTLAPDTPDLLPGIPARALFEPQKFPPHNTAATLTLPGHEADTACKQNLAALPKAARIAVTPSKLDHPAPPPTLDPEAETPALPQLPAGPEQSVPHGGDWGTIIHRTMELAVNRGARTPELLQSLAAQAVRETLPEDTPLSARQYRQLTGSEAAVSYAQLTADLAGRAASDCAALLADGSPLRALLDQGEAVTEYPFYISVSDPKDELYRHLAANLSKAPEEELPIDLNGILDLAIRTPEGWTVVDYKTDRLGSDETEEPYCQRLRSHYGPQLHTYAMVLERLEHLPVRCFVCAIPLGGRLIELTGTPEPDGTLPGSAPSCAPSRQTSAQQGETDHTNAISPCSADTVDDEMLISSWPTDESLLYNRQSKEIFRKSIDPAIVREAFIRCFGIKMKQARFEEKNFAEVDDHGEKTRYKYYLGTATEKSKVPWYAIEKGYYEQNLLNKVDKILLLFFVYSKENILTVHFDTFLTEEIPAQWQKPDVQNRYRINYALRTLPDKTDVFIYLLEDGTERTMKTVDHGILLKDKTAEETL